jgi:hypothetical protein
MAMPIAAAKWVKRMLADIPIWNGVGLFCKDFHRSSWTICHQFSRLRRTEPSRLPRAGNLHRPGMVSDFRTLTIVVGVAFGVVAPDGEHPDRQHHHKQH